MDIHGKNMIGSALSAEGTKTFQGYDPKQGRATPSQFHEATPSEVARAAELAVKAVDPLRVMKAGRMADLLDAIREEILALGDDLVQQADGETALGRERLSGERDRTANQLKMFAGLVREGSWLDVRIDTPQPDRKPIPKPDLRRILQPIGPVAVFGASNFPLAFSVAGGDTASALAAGNPVIVKAHPAHPATSELVAGAIGRAVAKTGFPDGTFSLLHGQDPQVSIALVTHPGIKAVAFTGSQRAGRALFDAASRRPEPIPVFSEMGSVNPVFLLKSALETKAQATAEGIFRSVTLGVGQFCTSPGLVFASSGDGLNTLEARLGEHFEQSSPGTMLNPPIAKQFLASFSKSAALGGSEAVQSARESDVQRTEGRPGLLKINAADWLGHKEMQEEIFGPATILVRCHSEAEALNCAEALEGSLTATVHGTAEELEEAGVLVRVLSRKAGRVIFNGYPTGVEVGPAMQHGGPYPATTDSRFTSVGTAAIFRFARPVCYQNFPQQALPPELQDANPRGIWRLVDGTLTKDSVPGTG